MHIHSTSPPITSYIESGISGECFILLHGISSGAFSWEKQFITQKEHHRLIAWNAPGYDQSDPLDTRTPNAQHYAQRLKKLIDETGLVNFTLVGHSLGALIASAYASLYPKDVKRLILASVAQGYGFADAKTQEQVYRVRPQMLSNLGVAGLAEQRGPALLEQRTNKNLELVKKVMSKLTERGFKDASYLLAYDSIDNYMKEVTCPTQVIAGLEDKITTFESMKSLQGRYPHIDLVSIEEAGHLLYIDQPTQFNALVFKN